MPALKQYQLRVAAVAAKIWDSLLNVDKETVVIPCFFQDRGNIIKSDLLYFLGIIQPEGFAYCEKVKQEYIQKYGADENVAIEGITKEIGLPGKAMECFDVIGFPKLPECSF